MRHSYHREKLGGAVDTLATMAAPIQKRLEYAWLGMHTLMSHPFGTPQLQERWDEIHGFLTADKSDSDKGYVPQTCESLSDEEASAIASKIVDLSMSVDGDIRYSLEDEVRRLGGNPLKL